MNRKIAVSLAVLLISVVVIITLRPSQHNTYSFETAESYDENCSGSYKLAPAEEWKLFILKNIGDACDKMIVGKRVEIIEKKPAGEEKLLSITQAAAGQQLEDYVYVDMDHDGQKELIGSYPDEDNVYQTWYCSSDGETCCLVHQNNQSWDHCKIELLEFEDETHVVINAAALMGIWKNYSIIALEDKEISILVSNEYGYVYRNEDGDIVLDVEAYDGMYDPDFGMYCHTWKDTYLYFDGKSYKEYGATKITEVEYLSYENAQAIKDAIENELRQPDTPIMRYIKAYAEDYFTVPTDGVCMISADINSDGIGDLIEYCPANSRAMSGWQIANRLVIYLGTEDGGYELTYFQPVFDTGVEWSDIIEVLQYEGDTDVDKLMDREWIYRLSSQVLKQKHWFLTESDMIKS